jgi:hypothetical protein
MAKEEHKTKNGTVNGTNGKAKEQNGQKVIPKAVWKEFYTMWDATEYEELEAKEIRKILGKHLFVPLPKDVRNRKLVDDWFNAIKQFKEKGKGFGNYRVNFAGQTATLEKVFGDKPISPAEMTKTLHLYITDHHLASKGSEPKTENGKNGKNGKKTVVVNSIPEMEKAVAKIGKGK